MMMLCRCVWPVGAWPYRSLLMTTMMMTATVAMTRSRAPHVRGHGRRRILLLPLIAKEGTETMTRRPAWRAGAGGWCAVFLLSLVSLPPPVLLPVLLRGRVSAQSAHTHPQRVCRPAPVPGSRFPVLLLLLLPPSAAEEGQKTTTVTATTTGRGRS